MPTTRGVFLYPSDPEQIAATIESASNLLQEQDPAVTWATWKQFQTTGQVIFCAICKSLRFTDFVVADVTTLNFNLLFEIGFALGLNLPVIPIRDTSFIRDKRDFEELGLLDTIGYVDFLNSEALAASLRARLPVDGIPAPPTLPNHDSPIYVLKGPLDTEGAVRLMSTLKKSNLRFRSYDALETPRLSLQEARRQVGASLAVIAHLLSPDRQGHFVHNARCALVAGLAMASGKVVFLLQEGYAPQPIDYRDVVSVYTNPEQVSRFLERPILQVISRLQDATIRTIKRPARLLERLDIGDVAAENEIQSLRSYFVATAQFNDAKRGHARLVIGRKGSGKTAIFYAVRDAFRGRRSHLVLDLKPEGHQFTKLRETVLSHLTLGLQEHTLTAFWHYILLAELSLKIVDTEQSFALRDPERMRRFQRVAEAYSNHAIQEAGDFSERLLLQVNRLVDRFQSGNLELEPPLTSGQLTDVLFQGDIRGFEDALTPYLDDKEEVWILVDNLDKGWRTRGAQAEDILILRTLLEATRKLQRQLNRRDVEARCLVFLRNDIYELLLNETPDKGKDTAIIVDWDDHEIFREIIRRRLEATADLSGSFSSVWPAVFDTHVGTQESFSYILERTLMRPRDLLNFLHRCIEVAVNRGHDRVRQEDIIKAEATYSEDILLSTIFELRDVHPESDPVYEFLGCPTYLSKEDALRRVGYKQDLLELLVWFGFLGVQASPGEDPRFAYQVRHNLAKVLAPVSQGRARFVVHPAFRRALECIPVGQV